MLHLTAFRLVTAMQPLSTSPTDEGKVMQPKFFDPVILYLSES